MTRRTFVASLIGAAGACIAMPRIKPAPEKFRVSGLPFAVKPGETLFVCMDPASGEDHQAFVVGRTLEDGKIEIISVERSC